VPAKVIRKGERVEGVSYSYAFNYKGKKNWGFAFECDENGVLKPFENEAAADNYKYCLSHPDEFEAPFVDKSEWSYWSPKVIQCHCGEEVVLDRDYGYGIQCDCGQLYNAGGDELVPREYWEERIDDDY
jgi:hypothetical protein